MQKVFKTISVCRLKMSIKKFFKELFTDSHPDRDGVVTYGFEEP
jgi:hypothetical protein